MAEAVQARPTAGQVDATHQHALAEHLRRSGDYLNVKVLPDGSVAALQDLLYTRAICLGCNSEGWTRRFCFKDRGLAVRRFADLQSEDDEPAGFIARRGV